MVANARLSTSAKQRSEPTAISVNGTLVRSNSTKAIAAATSPPENSTSPVPSRFRTPSTSLMMRDTSAPVLLAS